MKRIIPIFLILALVLTACGGKPESGAAGKTPEELTAAYLEALNSAPSGDMGVETISSAEDDMAEYVFAMMGVTPEDVTAFAFRVSLMNVKAYAICLAMPAEGHEEAVKKGLEGYLETMQTNFEHYLEDQYEVAKEGKVEVLGDGTVALVICEGSGQAMNAIRDALK